MNETFNSRDRRIFEALNGIDEKYIAEVTERYEVFDPCASYAPTRRAKRRMAIRLTAFAACLVLVALCLPAISRLLQYYGIIGPGTEFPATTDPIQTDLPEPPETDDPDVTEIPDTDDVTENTDPPVPPEETSCFASYDSILEVLKNISNICAASANIAADRSSYRATLEFSSETEREWFDRLFESAVSARYEKDLPYGYSIGDVNGDGVNELLYLREDYMLLAVFSDNGSPRLIETFTDRYRGYIDTDGKIFTFSADNDRPDAAIYEISEGRDSLKTVSALAMTGSGHTEMGAYKLTGDKREEITRDEYWKLIKEAPFKDEDGLHTENNAGVEFVEFEKIYPALSEAEMIAIFEEVFAGKRTVSSVGADPKMFGYFYLGESEGEKVYMYMSDDVEMLYLDLDRDGYVEAVVNINDSKLYILRYDRESDTVNSYFSSSYADEIFYTNGEFGSSAYRYRIVKFGKNLPNTEIEKTDYAALGIEPSGEKVKWTKIDVVLDIDPPTPAGNDKISAEFSDTRPAGMNDGNSLIYIADSDNSAPMNYIVFTAREKLTNVRLYKLDASLYEYEFEKKLWHTHELTEDKPLLAGVVFYGSMTAYGISFRDEAGEEHHFAVRTRGDEGSLELVEYTPVGDDPYEEWLAAYVDLGFGEVCLSDLLYDATYDGPITYPATFKIARFDINRDGVEDILVTHGGYSETVVFDGASKGQSYQIFGFRSMYGMQTNGVFFWHERAGTVQVASRFKKGSLQTEEVYRREIGFEEDDEYQYFIAGVEVTEAEYNKCLAENEAPEVELETLDVVWKAVDYLGVG